MKNQKLRLSRIRRYKQAFRVLGYRLRTSQKFKIKLIGIATIEGLDILLIRFFKNSKTRKLRKFYEKNIISSRYYLLIGFIYIYLLVSAVLNVYSEFRRNLNN